ncbi:MAG: hypothetical protein ACNI27_08035 [Desulfovibrio sp.]
MRVYSIEEVNNEQAEKVVTAMNAKGFKATLDDMYYIPVPEDILDEEQKSHMEGCGPFMMTLEVQKGLEETTFRMELLIRASNILRCSCIAYATPEQREYMIDFLDLLIKQQDVSV